MKLFKRDNQQPKRQPQLMEGQNDFSFRRSRTLTGSPSSDIRTVADTHSHLQSPRLRLHQLHQHRKVLFGGLITSFAVVLVLGWLVGQFIHVPSAMTIAGAPLKQPPTEVYAQTIESYFAQRPTERFLFRLDHERLLMHVANTHPEIKDLKISSVVPGQFSINVELRKPLLLWQTGDTRLFVDDAGTAFKNNYFAPPTVSVDDQSGIRLEDVNVIASNRFIGFLGRVVSSVNEAGIGSVTKVIIPTGVTREVDIQLSGREYLIKTHIDREPAAQAHDVVEAVQHVEKSDIEPEYIDVRIAGKAFYREK